ncbi:hypothetical protein GGR56DRAFT_694763 [Xylariaceae sp. FL0804]|nr:hypothetical protein GGR56DRAFT_694763 [Xylariaceae sp. FL0804]
MQNLPFVPVSDLAPSASFYAAATQPLGLRYISADSSSIVFGDASSTPHVPVFAVRKAPGAGTSRLALSAHSPSAVSAFHAAALRARPDLVQITEGGDGVSNFSRPDDTADCAGIPDLDGNIMEVVYNGSPNYPSIYHGISHSSSREVSRVLDWNRAAAPSGASQYQAGSVATTRPATTVRARDDAQPTLLRRSVTTSTLEVSPQHQQQKSGSSTGSRVATGAVLGTVLGAAIGGAITYTMMRSDRERAPRQEFDVAADPRVPGVLPRPPIFQRRSTYPDPYPAYAQPRYVEVERTVERIHYDDPTYPPSSSRKYYPPPSFLARYSAIDGPPPPPRSRTFEEIDDRSSRSRRRPLSYYADGGSGSGRSRARGRSEAGGDARRPLMIADAGSSSPSFSSKHGGAAPRLLLAESEHRSSHAGGSSSRHSGARSRAYPEDEGEGENEVVAEYRSRAAPSSSSRHTSAASSKRTLPPAASSLSSSHHHHSHHHSSHASSRHTGRSPKAETYVSERSSARTVRPAATVVKAGGSAEPSAVLLPVRSRAGSASSRKSHHVSAAAAPTYVSARDLPLPASDVLTKADDEESLAPSDSISCVGTSSHHNSSSRHSHGSRRSHH